MDVQETGSGDQAVSIAQAIVLLTKAQALLDAERLSVAATYVQMAIDLCAASTERLENSSKATN